MTIVQDPVLSRLSERRAELVARRAAIVDITKSEHREYLSADEEERFNQLGEDLKAVESRIAELDEEDARSSRAAMAQRGTGSVRVGREARTYRPDGEASYFGDLVARQVHGDSKAAERLARHASEVAVEHRDLTRVDGAGGEFVPPAYMTALFAGLARPGRTTADLLNRMPLPRGTDSINIPRLTGGGAVAIQTADNAVVQESDPVDANVAAPVRTLAGQIDVAQQVLDQSPVAFDQILFADLAADHAQKLNTQVISGSGASGQVLGLRNVSGITQVTYTDASPTLPELLLKLADSYQRIATTRYMPPTAIVMHPRRWGWALAQLDSSNRPLIEATAGTGFNVIGTGDLTTAEGQVGSILGLPVYVDAGLPTTLGAASNEDLILMLRGEDSFLFEGDIRTRTLFDAGSATLTVRIQLWSYVAGAFGRYPTSIALIGGAGLAAPTF